MKTQRTKISAFHCLWILTLALMLPAQAPARTAPKGALKTGAQPAINAKDLFDHHCAGCHGSDGLGRTFPGFFMAATNLAKPAWQSKVTDVQINTSISKGHRLMPAFESKLSKAEISALVGYVRQLASKS